MLRQRVLTASVLLPPVVAGIVLLPTVAVAAIMAAIIIISAWEWSGLMTLTARWSRALYALGAAAAMLAAGAGWSQGVTGGVLALVLAGVCWWLVAVGWLLAFPRGLPAAHPAHARKALAGYLVLLPAWAAVVLLHGQESTGPYLLLFALALVWSADIGAYFAGRRFGRRQLAAAISPGKTREGVLGGMLAALVLAGAAALPLGLAVRQLPGFLVLCAVVVLASVAGDLTVSMFKRRAGVKDTGALLPGHGGFLDRIDSLTAALPVFFAGLPLARGLP